MKKIKKSNRKVATVTVVAADVLSAVRGGVLPTNPDKAKEING